MKKLCLLAMACGFTFSAVALEKPQNVAVIKDVKGAVTVSSAEAIKHAVNDMALSEGASILVSSDGAAIVTMNNGCTVRLKGSQHMRVDSTVKCAQLQAAVTDMIPVNRVAQAPIGGGLVSSPGSAAGATVGGIASGGISSGATVGGVATGAATGVASGTTAGVAIGVAGGIGLFALISNLDSNCNCRPISRQ